MRVIMPVMSLDELVAAAERTDIASMGMVINRIIEVIKSPKSNAVELKALIEIDPALSAIILRRANSAYYGLKRKLTNILDAIVCLGFDNVKELALSQTVGKIFKKDEMVYGYSRKSLWIHSLAVALCGKLIYRREYRMRGDEIYTAGIMHDLGILLMDQLLGVAYQPILERVDRDKVNLRDVEQEVFGYTHEVLGQRLMKSWHLPDEFSQAVGLAEQSQHAKGDIAQLAKTLHVCNIACQDGTLGYVESPQTSQKLYLTCLENLNLTELAVKVLMDETRQEIEKMQAEGWFN